MRRQVVMEGHGVLVEEGADLGVQRLGWIKHTSLAIFAVGFPLGMCWMMERRESVMQELQWEVGEGRGWRVVWGMPECAGRHQMGSHRLRPAAG